LPEILQLLCASFSAYGYPPMLLFRILFKINLKSLLFDDLVIVNHLSIKKPKLFLEIIEKKIKIVDE